MNHLKMWWWYWVIAGLLLMGALFFGHQDAAANTRERSYTMTWYTGTTGACGPLTGRYLSVTNTHWPCGTRVKITANGETTRGVVKDYFGSDCSMCIDAAPVVFDDIACLGDGVVRVKARKI